MFSGLASNGFPQLGAREPQGKISSDDEEDHPCNCHDEGRDKRAEDTHGQQCDDEYNRHVAKKGKPS